jgi:transposase
LIEAAHQYRRQPAVGKPLEIRQRDQPPEIINISWRAQRRLNARWRQLKDARHKPNGIAAIAIARELAAFCWEIATWNDTIADPFRETHRYPLDNRTSILGDGLPPGTAGY